MKKLISKSRLLISLVLVVAMLLIGVMPVSAANPTVTMTVTAGIISITNTQNTWALGSAILSEIIYFSATNAQDDDYSTVNNTGNLAVDVEIQGTNFVGGGFDWTLAAASGDKEYSLYVNSDNGSGAAYDIEVKSSAYNDLTTCLLYTSPSPRDRS